MVDSREGVKFGEKMAVHLCDFIIHNSGIFVVITSLIDGNRKRDEHIVSL